MRIGWVVDHPKRDLAGSVLAAYQLASRGASVAIVPMYEQGVDVPRLGLDTLVANYARAANLDLMRVLPRRAWRSMSSTPRAACWPTKAAIRRPPWPRISAIWATPTSCQAISSGATGCAAFNDSGTLGRASFI